MTWHPLPLVDGFGYKKHMQIGGLLLLTLDLCFCMPLASVGSLASVEPCAPACLAFLGQRLSFFEKGQRLGLANHKL